MHISTFGSMGNLSLVEPHQVHGMIGPAAPETLGPRVLELSSILQTTLDLEHQFMLFSQSIKQHLSVDGLEYSHPDEEEVFQFGDTSTHRASYELTLEQQSLGKLRFYRAIPLTNREIKLLENLLCGLVYPLRNSLRYLAAVSLASIDPLTGVQNRLAMDIALQREVDLAQRQSAPLSVLVIDADHFKRFNDKYGHAFGDDILRALAGCASTTVRSSDLLFRFGGEEFVVVAAHTGLQGATLLAERIRRCIQDIKAIRGQKIELSVSIGVTELGEGDTPQSLFERSDEAMYQAKEGGRNRVVAV